MHIVVCLKQVPDPEGPADAFVISQDRMKVEPRGIPPVISVYDENALEAALRVKDSDPDKIKVTILTMGSRISNAVMMKALAVGADDVTKVESALLESGHLDSRGNALAIAAAIRKMGDVDIIFVGRQSADWNAGMTGIGIAHYLDIPVVTLATQVGIDTADLVITRQTTEGQEKVKVAYPAVVIAGEIGEVRYPTMKQRQDAKKKPFTTWTVEDIGFDCNYQNQVILRELNPVEMRKADCAFMTGDSPEEMGKKLIERLQNDKVL
jgi:electron transfer flavoprotein beta subunit